MTYDRERADLEFGVLIGMTIGMVMGGVIVWVVWMVTT